MFKTLAIIAGSSLVIAAVCFGGAAALAGPELAKSEFWRDFDWQNFEWEDDDAAPINTGPAVTQARDVTGFTSVSVGGGVRTEITVGPEFHVEVVSADPDYITTDVLGSRLTIQPSRSNNRWWRSHRPALVRVAMPAIDGIRSSAGSHVVATGVNAETLALEASAGAQLEVSGTCRALDSEVSSGASIDADELVCERGAADASSGGSSHINVTGQLDVDASSGGSIHTEGSPQIGQISLSSGGSLDRD